jgi:hypothetical protein
MGWRGTMALLALALVVGVALWLEGPSKPQLPEDPPNLLGEPKLRDPSKFVPLLAFEPAAVLRVRIRHGDNELTAEREGEGWRSSRPSSSIDAFLGNLAELGRIIEIPASNGTATEYGLDQPKSVVELTIRGAQAVRVLELGDPNPPATGVYARVDRQGPIVLAGALATWELDKLFRGGIDQVDQVS